MKSSPQRCPNQARIVAAGRLAERDDEDRGSNREMERGRARNFHGRATLQRAFTLMEVLTVVAIMMVLATLMLPVVARTKSRSIQLECLSQLRQQGIGFISYAQDHGDKFPFQVPVKDGGTLELVKAAAQNGGEVYYAFRHFQAISNEVNEPRVFRCPADFRRAAETMSSLKNENVSYFIAITAEPGRPDSLLAGDRNIAESGATLDAITKIAAMNKPQWTQAGHEFKGNLLFAGGHVERTGSSGLTVAFRDPTGPVNVWNPVADTSKFARYTSSSGGSPGNATASDSQRGFAMLQDFFQSSSSGSPGTAGDAGSRQTSRVVQNTLTPSYSSHVNVDAAAAVTNKPNPVIVATVPAARPILPLEEPSSTNVPNESQAGGILAVMIDPERCWWCWWLILGASVLAALIFGSLVFRHRRARRRAANAWRPAWEVPQAPVRR